MQSTCAEHLFAGQNTQRDEKENMCQKLERQKFVAKNSSRFSWGLAIGNSMSCVVYFDQLLGAHLEHLISTLILLRTLKLLNNNYFIFFTHDHQLFKKKKKKSYEGFSLGTF